MEGKSDHRAVYAVISLSRIPQPRQKRTKALCGWKPSLDAEGNPSHYHALLTEGLSNGHQSLVDVGAIAVAAAQDAGAAGKTAKRKPSDEVVQLRAARRREPNGEMRKLLSKSLWRALRSERRLRHDQEVREVAERGQGLRHLQRVQQRQAGIDRTGGVRNASGVTVFDNRGIAEAFAQFYEDF